MSDDENKTVKECLETLGFELTVENNPFVECDCLKDEFKIVKKKFHRMSLTHHPDKGGDTAVFRSILTSFEVLRELFSSDSILSFSSEVDLEENVNEQFKKSKSEFEKRETSPYSYYEAAAEEHVPLYRVEIAKSSRGKCFQKSKVGKKCAGDPSNIMKGEIRVGYIDKDSGMYGKWVHLGCWRVPSQVWLGCPDPIPLKKEKKKAAGKKKKQTVACSSSSSSSSKELVLSPLVEQYEASLLNMNEVLLCGLGELTKGERSTFVEHVMNKTNWARFSKKKKTIIAAAPTQSNQNSRYGTSSSSSSNYAQTSSSSSRQHTNNNYPGATNNSSMLVVSSNSVLERSIPQEPASSTALVPAPSRGRGGQKRDRFRILIPGVNGAQHGALEGKTIVMTGIFPELGGGIGLNIGKDKAKRMLLSFGAKVTGSVSGRTDILLVGTNPGFSKVSNARARGTVRLMSLKDMKDMLEGVLCIEDSGNNKPMVITNFSSGYKGNSLADSASPHQLAIASGTMAPQPLVSGYRRSTTATTTTTSNYRKNSTTSKRKRKEITEIIDLIEDEYHISSYKRTNKYPRRSTATVAPSAYIDLVEPSGNNPSSNIYTKDMAVTSSTTAADITTTVTGPDPYWSVRIMAKKSLLHQCTVKMLKDFLRSESVRVSGNKYTIIERVKDHLYSEL